MFAAPVRIASNKENKAQRRWHEAKERLPAVCSVYITVELIFQSQVKMEPPDCTQSHQGPMPGHGAGRAAVTAVDSEPPPARRHRRRGDRPPREPGGADYDGTGRDGRQSGAMRERRPAFHAGHTGRSAREERRPCEKRRAGTHSIRRLHRRHTRRAGARLRRRIGKSFLAGGAHRSLER